MKKDFVTQYLITNGKYFPENRLLEIGNKLENNEGLEYAINVKYFTTLKGILFTLLFAPFDRVILRDYFLGFLKIGLFISSFLSYFMLRKQDFIYIKIPFTDNSLQIGTEDFIPFLWLLFIIWQILDLITAYYRVKKTNYKKIIEIINEQGKSISFKRDVKDNSEIKKWIENNPHSSINDFYKMKK